MHVFFKDLVFFHSFTALYLFSNSVSAQTGGGELLSKMRTGVGREREGTENWELVRTSFMDDIIHPGMALFSTTLF